MKAIEGFPNYLVSESGEVFSVRRGKYLRLTPDPGGYIHASLSKDGKQYNKHVHRLVATAFIPNPNNLPEVNHIDMNKANNSVSNLEWCDRRYNHFYGGEKSSAATLARARKKPVSQILNGIVVATFESATEAQRLTGIFQSNISKCCLHRKGFLSAGGYEWDFIK